MYVFVMSDLVEGFHIPTLKACEFDRNSEDGKNCLVVIDEVFKLVKNKDVIWLNYCDNKTKRLIKKLKERK